MNRSESESGVETASVRRILRDAVPRLTEAGLETPSLDAQVMLSRATGLSRTAIFAHPEYIPSQDEVSAFDQLIDRRVRREPLAYIIGEREFYGIRFEVNPAVLVPRQETEILVEAAVRLLRGKPEPVVADIGVGSGAIAVSLAATVENCIVYATDSSLDALVVARRNAGSAGVGGRVHFILCDLAAPLVGMRFDLIASNPPYIQSAVIDTLDPEVSRYEPRSALDGGPDGLMYYRRLSADAAALLKPGGVLIVEVGLGQSDAVGGLFCAAGLEGICTVRDYAGIERVVVGTQPFASA